MVSFKPKWSFIFHSAICTDQNLVYAEAEDSEDDRIRPLTFGSVTNRQMTTSLSQCQAKSVMGNWKHYIYEKMGPLKFVQSCVLHTWDFFHNLKTPWVRGHDWTCAHTHHSFLLDNKARVSLDWNSGCARHINQIHKVTQIDLMVKISSRVIVPQLQDFQR